MSLGKMMVSAAALLIMFSGWSATAQEKLTCADIKFLTAVTDMYPDIADACYGVVKKNGKMMAKVKAVVVGVRPDQVSFRLLRRDNTTSGVYRTDLKPNWGTPDGIRLTPEDLKQGMTMSLYIPNDRWAVAYEDDENPDTVEVVDIYEAEDTANEPEPMAEPGPEPAAEPAPVMPATAGPLPLIGLLGAGFLTMGAGFRLLRHRFR